MSDSKKKSVAELSDILTEYGFDKIGSGWFRIGSDTIRARVWNDGEVDFWLRNGADEDELRYRGVIIDIADVGFVMERCFDGKFTKKQ